jgi:hypothetical protein
MGAETIGTLVITAVLVAVLAVFVTLVGLGLRRLSFTLGTIVIGLRAIRLQTQPVGDVLAGVLGDVTNIERDLGEAAEAPAVAPSVAAGDHEDEAGYGDEAAEDEGGYENGAEYEETDEEAEEYETEYPPFIQLNVRPEYQRPRDRPRARAASRR